MTRRRMPERGPHGEFLRRDAPSDAQRVTSERSALPSPSGASGGREDRRCEECGSRFEYRTVRLYGMVLDIGSCPMHAPDPVSRILEMSR